MEDVGQRIALHQREADVGGEGRQRAVFTLRRFGPCLLVDVGECADPLMQGAVQIGTARATKKR